MIVEGAVRTDHLIGVNNIKTIVSKKILKLK